MTNERAVEILNLDLDILGQYGDETAEAYKMAIQALEQQPFINKPCVSEGVCREDKIQVLDKIRAEINNINLNEVAMKYKDRFYGFQREVIKIVDKYKAESEDAE